MRHDFLRAQSRLDERAKAIPEHALSFVNLVLLQCDKVMNGEPVECVATELELLGKVGARRQ